MQRIRHLAARTANEVRGSYRFLSQLQRLLHCSPCQGVGTQQRDYRGTLSVICARLLCQRLIKPLRYRRPSTSIPFRLKCLKLRGPWRISRRWHYEWAGRKSRKRNLADRSLIARALHGGTAQAEIAKHGGNRASR
jgi:hypothetical protein